MNMVVTKKTCNTQPDCSIEGSQRLALDKTWMNATKSLLHQDQPEHSFDVSNPVFLTENAWKKLQEFQSLHTHDDHVLRLIVVKKGCAGMMYDWLMNTQTMNQHDLVIRQSPREIDTESLTGCFVVDRRIIFYLLGLVIDYQRTPIYSKFIFFRQGGQKSCGCGMSFRTSAD